MEPLEQTTITDHSSELLEASNPSEVLELEDDLTAILRAKDATIKIKSAENHIQASMLKQKDEAIAKLKKALEFASRQFDAIYFFNDFARCSQLSVVELYGVLKTSDNLAYQGRHDCQEAIKSIPGLETEKTTPNRED